MAREIRLPEPLVYRDQFGVGSDFNHYVSADEFTTVASDSGGIAVTAGAVGGIAVISPSDGSVADNDETYLRSTTAIFKYADDQPLIFECRVAHAEANTDDANLAFGVSSAVAANMIVDDGAGLAANQSGACIYKVDGGTVWKCLTSIGTTQTISTSTQTVDSGASSYHEYKITISPLTATVAEVSFFYDGAQLVDSNKVPIKHQVTYTGGAAMYAFVGAKNGGANHEQPNVDYVHCYQLRAA